MSGSGVNDILMLLALLALAVVVIRAGGVQIFPLLLVGFILIARPSQPRVAFQATPTPRPIRPTPTIRPSAIPRATVTPNFRTLPIGQESPDFQLSMFNGDQFSLADNRGQVVLINFWASWCPPCQEEAPDMQDIWTSYQSKGLVMIGIAQSDTEPDAKGFIDKYKLTFPSGLDVGNAVGKQYLIDAIPTTIIVDRDGIVQFVNVGSITANELRPKIDQVLNQ